MARPPPARLTIAPKLWRISTPASNTIQSFARACVAIATNVVQRFAPRGAAAAPQPLVVFRISQPVEGGLFFCPAVFDRDRNALLARQTARLFESRS